MHVFMPKRRAKVVVEVDDAETPDGADADLETMQRGVLIEFYRNTKGKRPWYRRNREKKRKDGTYPIPSTKHSTWVNSDGWCTERYLRTLSPDTNTYTHR